MDLRWSRYSMSTSMVKIKANEMNKGNKDFQRKMEFGGDEGMASFSGLAE